MSETRVETREAFIFAEGKLHASGLRLADQATVVGCVCEGLFFVCHVVPVRTCGLCFYLRGYVFAEEVAVQEDAFIFL